MPAMNAANIRTAVMPFLLPVVVALMRLKHFET
jgi:hypothetical protein